jgi:diguanylate cyclase (GGDEF)-like protein
VDVSRPYTVLALERNVGGLYHGELLAGLIREVSAHGGHVVVAETRDPGTDGTDPRSAPGYRLPTSWDQVDGVVSVGHAATREYVELARAEGKPVVLAGHELENLDGPVVLPDNQAGVRGAVQHLLSHGHTRIGFVGSMDQRDHRERRAAYEQTMAEHDAPVDDKLFFAAGTPSRAGGAAAAAAFLASGDRPTALMVASDENALGMIAALGEAGIAVPDDVAVVGFENTAAGALTVPSLTSVGARFDEVGALAGNLLLALLDGKEVAPGTHTAGTTFLATRSSCGCERDLIDLRPGQEPVPVRVTPEVARSWIDRELRALLDSAGAPDTQSTVDEVIGATEALLSAVPGNDELHRYVGMLTALAPDPETVQRAAARLNDFVQRLADGAPTAASAVSLVRAVLWELEARGYLHKSRRLEGSALEVDRVASDLLRSAGSHLSSLEWLNGTHVRAGALALWDGPPDEGRLRVAGVFDSTGGLTLAPGDVVGVRAFPPPDLVSAADGADGETCVVLRVATAEHDLGLLAVLGDNASVRETYHHWAEMLCRALERERLEAAVRTSEERYEFATKAARDGLWEFGLAAGHIRLTASCRELLDVNGDVDQAGWLDTVHPEYREAVLTALTDASVRGDTPVEVEYQGVRQDGTTSWLLLRAFGVESPDGTVSRIFGSLADVSERRKLEEQLRRAALYDPVTGLPNRRLFLDRLTVAMEQPRRRPGAKYAVLFLDLDGFKLINDSLGYQAGDQLLREIGSRLRSQLRSVDAAARFGGDEFALLLSDPVPEELLVVASRIQERINEPVRLGEHEVSVTVSIGIAASESGYEDPEDVLRDADIAMDSAKETEPGSASLFDPAMHQRAMGRLHMRTAVLSGLAEKQFVVHYQPVVALNGAALSQFEALVRWDHPERGILLPGEFLPAMEGNATIVALGHQVLDQVCAQIAGWRQTYTGPLAVSMNLAHREFWAPDLVPTVHSALARYAVPAECLIIEITESVIMTDPGAARSIMTQLHAEGIRLHIDDFGTGQSSLHALRTFPVDALKIDGSFVRELTVEDPSGAALVRTIVSMGDALGLGVVAECVETVEQADALRGMGCTTAQGWLYARAMPGDKAGALLGTDMGSGPDDRNPGARWST